MAEDIKTPKQAPASEDNSLIPLINYTDPIVIHDGKSLGSGVAKALNKQNAEQWDEDGNFGMSLDYEAIKVEGIYTPIVQLNNTVLQAADIDWLEIEYCDFYPTLHMILRGPDISNLEFNDAPGMNNKVTVIIIPAKDGAYRKVSLDFTIYDYNRTNDILNVTGRVKWLPLEQQKCEAIIYPGCSHEKCNPGQNKKPNTFEYLHEIAAKTGLGFAATDQCKQIQDRLPRLVQSVSFLDFIDEQIRFGGLDENSIFDVWLDLYGYITLVNIPYIITNDITYRHLSIKVIKGIRGNTNDFKDLEIEETHRTFTNFNKMPDKSNVEISRYKWNTSFENVNATGTLQTQHTFTPIGVQSGNNNLSSSQVEIIENSIDGSHADDYETASVRYNVVEVNDYNIKTQEMVRDNFLNKMNSKILEVELLYPNLGVQRGSLINLGILEENPDRKRKLLTSSSNMAGSTDTEFENPDSGVNNKDLIQAEGEMVPDITMSGLYYVRGMKFEYCTFPDRQKDIKQTLYLYKKGPMTNIENKYTSPKADEFAFGDKQTQPASIPGLIPHF